MILIPLSDHPFYLWQALVQMHALQGQRARWLVYCPTGSPSPLLAAIMRAGGGGHHRMAGLGARQGVQPRHEAVAGR